MGNAVRPLQASIFEISGHAAELEKTLEPALAERWRSPAGEPGLSTNYLPLANGKTTRDDFLQAAAKARQPAAGVKFQSQSWDSLHNKTRLQLVLAGTWVPG